MTNWDQLNELMECWARAWRPVIKFMFTVAAVMLLVALALWLAG